MKLRYTKTALRQIDKALSYIKDRSPQGATNIGERVAGIIAMLEDHPYVGQATSRRGARRVVLTPYPYVIFYRIAGEEVIVMRFRHTARRPLFETRGPP
ncbi:hypothetical protein GCM10007874_35060 [Labrys miyagiensis]|uniref:Type II toxin-antitoxin system RelE/ParE family toxin n=1 Tax=Labrys miyagiensis TaxID=346912 RepID=A0ABQ6CP57_9HYPH|nr:type II toxin-antitoxin system RelE/ParE family toxin [Labrys miyagiensis]GLS20489.1 hypothetical protein GCM10007874_35060 [Labrys miyagiensis]